jgi:hypothetical protein
VYLGVSYAFNDILITYIYKKNPPSTFVFTPFCFDPLEIFQLPILCTKELSLECEKLIDFIHFQHCKNFGQGSIAFVPKHFLSSMLLFLSCHYCSKWRRPWSWRFALFKVQGSTPLGCKQSLRITSPGEKPAIYPVPCRKIFEGAVHGTEVYSLGVGPKGPCKGYPI